jgi:predicted amidohydrolase
MSIFKTSLIQFDIVWEDKDANFRKITSMTDNLEPETDLIVLPELFSTGWTMHPGDFAENLRDGASVSFLAELARKYKCHVVGSFIEKTDGKPRNTAVISSPDGEVVLQYSKIHLMSLTGEHEHYARGDKVPVLDLNGNRIAVIICYDLRFPELFVELAKQDVQCVIDIANWPAERINHWDVLLSGRAIENQVYMAGLNRVGKSPSLMFTGHSAVIDPWGNTVAAAAGYREEVLNAEIDFAYVEKVRKDLPVLEDKVMGR